MAWTSGPQQQRTKGSRSPRATLVRSLLLTILVFLAHDLMMLDGVTAHGGGHQPSAAAQAVAPVHHVGGPLKRAGDAPTTLSDGSSLPDEDGTCGVALQAVILANNPVQPVVVDHATIATVSTAIEAKVPAGTLSSGHDPTQDPQVRRALLQIYRV